MCILKYRMRNEWWKCPISNKNPLIRKNVFTLDWGGFWLVRKRVNANNGRWKCILRINSSKRIKKVMWLCAMRQDNLTSSRLISFTASEMLLWSFWNAWAKSVVKVFLYNCLKHDWVHKQQHSPPKAVTAFIVFRLLALRRKSFFIYETYYIQQLILVFYRLFSASLPGSDDFVLFDSSDGNGARLQMFYAIFQVKFATLDGNPAIGNVIVLVFMQTKSLFFLLFVICWLGETIYVSVRFEHFQHFSDNTVII